MKNENTITCPKCGAEIPLSEAVSHRVREQLAADFENERRQLNAAVAGREQKLAAERRQLEQQQQALQEEVVRRLEAARQELFANAAHQAEDRFGMQLRDLQARVDEQRAKLDQARDAELGLRKRHRELEEAKANLELEVARRLDEERKKVAGTARQQAAEAERLKLAEKDQVIKGLQQQIAALQQRAEQGSIQIQGETLEATLERDLCAAFPYDEISEIKNGQRGADVLQRVRTSAGLECGAILWEAKRAKNWSRDWPERLKEDQREAKAELAVIAATSPPEGVRGIGQADGVWVCEPPFAVALAYALRHGLIGTAVQRQQQANRADKIALLYDYVCSVEFRQQIEALVESHLALLEQLAAEQRAFARQWKEREQQLQKAIAHAAMLYGGIQGITGRDALPALKTLELPSASVEARL